jgi:hypothetical protein
MIKPYNNPMPKVHIYLQTQFKINKNIKINPYNYPIPKVHIYLQKQVHNNPLQKFNKINKMRKQYKNII